MKAYNEPGCIGGCHTELNRHARVSIHDRNTIGITTGQPPSTIKKFIIAGWPDTKDELHANIRLYWPYRDELVIIDGVILKGRCIVIPNNLRQQVVTQLYTSHMGIEKTKLLAHNFVFWSNINANIKGYIKYCATCLEFQQMQPKEKITHHDIPLRPWEVVGADIFHLKNKHYLCIIDSNSQFPVIKRLEGLSVENIINMVKIVFAEHGIP